MSACECLMSANESLMSASESLMTASEPRSGASTRCMSAGAPRRFGLRIPNLRAVAVWLLVLMAPIAPARAQTFCIDGPCGFNLVGFKAGVADPHGEIRLRIGVGPTCTPVGGVPVELDFTRCKPDIRLCATQDNVACPLYLTSTDADGYITIRLGGASNNTGASPGYSGAACGGGCVTVRIHAEPIGTLSVGAFDQNGGGGVNPADISLWLSDAFAPQYVARSDYDFSNRIGPADLALLLQVSLDGNSVTSGNPYCL
jgi:hypothetical protein